MRGGGIERERNSEILRERERDWKFERERKTSDSSSEKAIKRGACNIQYPPLYWQHW